LNGYQNGNLQLKWTDYKHPDNNFEGYFLEKLDENNNVYSSIPLNNSTTQYTDLNAINDRQILRYRIKVIISSPENIVSYSNIIEAKQKFKLFFPNAFAPNGTNNTFAPKGLFIKNFKMIIYSRSGEVIFTSNDINQGWDGMHKGTLAPTNTYIYLAEAEDFLGEKHQTQGTFVLIK
jgi:gliding motility-associated-like protein